MGGVNEKWSFAELDESSLSTLELDEYINLHEIDVRMTEKIGTQEILCW